MQFTSCAMPCDIMLLTVLAYMMLTRVEDCVFQHSTTYSANSLQL